MKREQLELEVNRLLHEWIATDTRPSRYAAWLLLLKIWLWKADDGEDHEPFPNEYLNRLIQMVHDQNRATRATALSAVVMIVYNEQEQEEAATSHYRKHQEEGNRLVRIQEKDGRVYEGNTASGRGRC